MPKSRFLKQKDYDEIIRLTKLGYSGTQVAARVGCGIATVHVVKRKYGVRSIRNKKFLDHEIQNIVDKVSYGYSIHSVAKEFDRATQTVWALCNRNGVKSIHKSPKEKNARPQL